MIFLSMIQNLANRLTRIQTLNSKLISRCSSKIHTLKVFRFIFRCMCAHRMTFITHCSASSLASCWRCCSPPPPSSIAAGRAPTSKRAIENKKAHLFFSPFVVLILCSAFSLFLFFYLCVCVCVRALLFLLCFMKRPFYQFFLYVFLQFSFFSFCCIWFSAKQLTAILHCTQHSNAMVAAYGVNFRDAWESFPYVYCILHYTFYDTWRIIISHHSAEHLTN